MTINELARTVDDGLFRAGSLAWLVAFALTGSVVAQDTDLSKASNLVIEKANAFREQHDEERLATNEMLTESAKAFANYMAENDVYGHHADGRTPAERVKAKGYEYCVVRENIAYRSVVSDVDFEKLAKFFHQGWVESPEHRENMLAEYVTQTGVAMATSDGQTFFAVQLFGRPKSEAYQVRLTNDTDTQWPLEIESDGGVDEIEIPSHGVLKMRRCLPSTIRVTDSAASYRVKSSADLTLRLTDDTLNIVEDE